MLCGEWSLVNPDERSLRAHPLRCRCWTCEECGEIRRSQLKRLARDGTPNTFLTLTVSPNQYNSPQARAQALVRAWRTVRRRAKKRYRYDRIPFLAVFERTKRGEPHLHILLRCRWLDQKWLSKQMRDLLRSPIVDIRRIHDARKIARYVSKYVSKAPEKFAGCKRYWRSQDYKHRDPAAPAETPSDHPCWRVVRHSLAELQKHLEQLGHSVSLRRDGWEATLEPGCHAPSWATSPRSPPDD